MHVAIIMANPALDQGKIFVARWTITGDFVTHATIAALKQLHSPEQVASKRHISVEQLGYTPKSAGVRRRRVAPAEGGTQ